MLTHNIKKICRYCKKDVRIDRLLKHEVLCKSQVDEKICNRSVGVHQHIETDPDCSSVLGYFNSYNLNVEDSSDYDVILVDTCDAAKPKLIECLTTHPIKAHIIVTLFCYKYTVDGSRHESEKSFRSFCEPLIVRDVIDEFLMRSKETLRIGIEQYERIGKGGFDADTLREITQKSLNSIDEWCKLQREWSENKCLENSLCYVHLEEEMEIFRSSEN